MLKDKTVRLIVRCIFAMRSLLFIHCKMMNESKIPIKHPKKVRIIFSTINCPTKVIPEAPNALRTPISEERSIIRLILIFTRFRVGNSINSNTKTVAINASFATLLDSGSPNGVELKKLAT